MKNFKFKIAGNNPEKDWTIYVSSRFGRNDKLMYATPLRIKPKFWNQELEQVRNSMLCPNHEGINNALAAIKNKLTDFMLTAVANGTPITKETLHHALDIHFRKVTPEGCDFHTCFQDYIDGCMKRMNNKRGGQTITYKTMREYTRTFSLIQQYEHSGKKHLEFDDINTSFADDFVAFLQELNLSTNTIGNKITCIKAFMRDSYQKGYTTNDKYQFIKGQSEDSDSVALSEDELQAIQDCDIKIDRLVKVRDIFLVGCWTGLRFSDIGILRREHIDDNGIICITQSKPNNKVCIPLHPIVKEILEKYHYHLPCISNQKFNAYIKEVCNMAGIDKPFIKSITRGGKKEIKTYPKWQLVSSHTARRSFATNLYLAGVPAITIMSVTGHKTETAFLKYIKVSKTEHAKKIADFWSQRHDYEQKLNSPQRIASNSDILKINYYKSFNNIQLWN